MTTGDESGPCDNLEVKEEQLEDKMKFSHNMTGSKSVEKEMMYDN